MQNVCIRLSDVSVPIQFLEIKVFGASGVFWDQTLPKKYSCLLEFFSSTHREGVDKEDIMILQAIKNSSAVCLPEMHTSFIYKSKNFQEEIRNHVVVERFSLMLKCYSKRK